MVPVDCSFKSFIITDLPFHSHKLKRLLFYGNEAEGRREKEIEKLLQQYPSKYHIFLQLALTFPCILLPRGAPPTNSEGKRLKNIQIWNLWSSVKQWCKRQWRQKTYLANFGSWNVHLRLHNLRNEKAIVKNDFHYLWSLCEGIRPLRTDHSRGSVVLIIAVTYTAFYSMHSVIFSLHPLATCWQRKLGTKRITVAQWNRLFNHPTCHWRTILNVCWNSKNHIYIYFWKPNNSWLWLLSPKKQDLKILLKVHVLEINFHSTRRKFIFIYRFYLQIKLVKTSNKPSPLKESSRAKNGKKTWFHVCSYPCSHQGLQKHLERNFSPFHRCYKRPSHLAKDKRIGQYQPDKILKYFFQPLTF